MLNKNVSLFVCLHSREIWCFVPVGTEVDYGTCGVITSPTCLGPVWVWSQQNY